MQPGTMAASALDYLRRGWSVIPIHAANKRPLVRWQAFQYRPADSTQVEEWFRRWPDANVAIITGVASGFIVIDIDPIHGGDTSMTDLEATNGALPITIEAVSGGGGRHLYFAHPGGVVRNRVGVAPGIDARGDGGYVIAPPSLHASGKRYAWRTDRGPDQMALARMPDWLLRMVTSQSKTGGHLLEHWRQLAREGVSEGERNNAIASFSGHLLWHGVDPAVTLELLLCWNNARCRPPLNEEEVVRTVESISRLHQRHGDDKGPQSLAND